MSLLGQVLSAVSAAFGAAALAGLVWRRRARACRAFALYLATAALGHLLLLIAPQAFWNWEFLTLTDALQAGLQLAIVAEIGGKAFHALPVGYRHLRLVLGCIALATAFAALPTLSPRGGLPDAALHVERVFYGIGFLFIAFMAVVRYHGVPLDPLHRAVATGFAVIALLSGCVSALAALDPASSWGRDFIVKTAYPCVLAWWTVNAWRRDDFGRLSLEAVRRLHPWRLP